MILRAAVFCTIVTFCTIAGYILFDNAVTVEKAYAAVSKYGTISNGEWSENVWSDVSVSNATCNCAPTCNLGTPAHIKNKIKVLSCSNFAISGVHVDIDSGGQFYVQTTKFTISGGGSVYVAPGDSLLVKGKLELSGGSSIVCDGILAVDGDVKLSGNSTITGNGNGYVINGGTISGSGWGFTGVLPIKLASFEAAKKSKSVLINWTTASEINNDYFTIERSSNGTDFYSIKTIKGAGNSTQALNYSFEDVFPVMGDNYYRLRQTDYDGTTEVFTVKHVNFQEGNSSIVLFPNPSQTNEGISLRLPGDKFTGRLNILTSRGDLVVDEAINSSSREVRIEPLGLSKPGVYILVLLNERNERIALTNFIRVP